MSHDEMKIKFETRCQREMALRPNHFGDLMCYDDPLVALDCDLIAPNSKAIRINGEWFVPADDSMSLMKEWEDAEHDRTAFFDV